MIDNVIELIRSALRKTYENGLLKQMDNFNPYVVKNKNNKKNGDYTSSISLKIASTQRMAPRKISEIIISYIKTGVFDVTVSGPGFINFKKKKQ